ncbi:hypothetical protein [Ferrimonas sp.]|uniref:hypothetical protein n=1 Tax=Ferrimonas sp. TaxID=2080861 RepID=UPI003A959BE0
MKRSLLALLLTNLVLAGCGSDSNNDASVPPVEPEVPVETIPVEQATSIQVLNPEAEGVTGQVTFELATEVGVAITGLKQASLAYVGFPVSKQWDHITDTMGLPWHQAQTFGCDDDSCTIDIEEIAPGSYALTPNEFQWVSEPVSVRTALTLAGQPPVWIESTLP